MNSIYSFKVATTLAAQRIVAKSTSTAFTVAYPEASDVLPYGVTLDTVLDTNQAIPVKISGEAKVLFNDTVACGALVASDTSGRGIPFTPGNTTAALTVPTGVIGTLIDTSVDATGTVAKVLINPMLMR